jgi:dTDP-4-dehydrorhamnose reductase
MLAPNKFLNVRPEPCVPLPLLITGLAGVPGYNAWHYFRERYPGQVVGVRQSDNWRLTGDGVVPCDAEDRDGLLRLFEQHRFRSVLDCSGNCALRACELAPHLAWRINFEGAKNLIDAIEQVYGDPARADSNAPRLVRLSIDLVYSGRGYGNHLETDPTDPVHVYGRTMAASEAMVTARYPSAALLRISLPMGVSFNGHAGAIDWIQSRFKKHRPATLYYDEIRNPHYTDCLNELCETMLSYDRLVEPLSGVFNASGPRRLSVFEIAQVINRVGGYDPDLLMGCRRLQAGPIPPRAGNTTLDMSKLVRALGYEPNDPWPFDARFVPTDRLWHYHRDGEPGSPELLAEVLYRNPGRRGG